MLERVRAVCRQVFYAHVWARSKKELDHLKQLYERWAPRYDAADAIETAIDRIEGNPCLVIYKSRIHRSTGK